MSDDAVSLGLRVLVVDDERICRDSLQTLLVSCDHDVQSASDGDQALDIAQTFNPDVAIVDWMLGPAMDGLSVAESIHDMRPSTRIVITSGNTDLQREVPSDAPYAYLMKPYRLSELLALFGDTAG